jgi:hypothetical protein
MKVNDFRLSGIWVEAFPEQLGSDDRGVLGPTVRRNDYAKRFNGLLTSDTDPLMTFPWTRTAGKKYPAYNRYWNDYIIDELSNHSKADAGIKAWRSAVPMRHKATLVRINRRDRCYIEGWYWPHGIALTVTLWCRRSLDPKQLGTEVQNFLHGALNVNWPDGRTADTTLNGLVNGCLDRLREAGFDSIEAGLRPPPMLVLTVVDAKHEAADTDQAAAKKAMMNAAISAAGGNPDGKIESGRDVYTFSRGRLIWRADRALSDDKVHTLGCLHRNITMATTQVASLLSGAEILSAFVQAGGQGLSARVEPYARVVGGTIGRIYGTKTDEPEKDGQKTYRQECLRSQIAAANATGGIDVLRQALNMSRLDPPAAKESSSAAKKE